MNLSQKTVLFATTLSLLTATAATADEVAPLPGAPTTPPLPTQGIQPQARATTEPAGPEAGPGPLQAERRALLERIIAAKSQGIGIGAYLGEFNRIEGLVKDGQPESEYQGRIASLSSNLDDQIKRSQILKSQRPESSGSSSFAAPSSGGSLGLGSGMGGHSPLAGMSPEDKSKMIEQLKAKFGDRIPSGLGGGNGMPDLSKLDPEQKERLMNSDMGKQIMKKYFGQ